MITRTYNTLHVVCCVKERCMTVMTTYNCKPCITPPRKMSKCGNVTKLVCGIHLRKEYSSFFKKLKRFSSMKYDKNLSNKYTALRQWSVGNKIYLSATFQSDHVLKAKKEEWINTVLFSSVVLVGWLNPGTLFRLGWPGSTG